MLVDSSLSVIIPAYQAEKTIARAIKSVLTIDVDSLEVIVVNDGSTDSTSEMVRSIVSFDKRVNLIEQSNSGRSVARDVGFRAANGDWIMFVDADDFLLPDVSSAVQQGMNSGSEIESKVSETSIKQEKDNSDGKLSSCNAHGTHASTEKQKRYARSCQSGEHLPGLLILELLMRDDIGIEDGGEQRTRHIDGHNRHELPGKSYLSGSETSRKERFHVCGEKQPQRKRDSANGKVQHEVHSIE